MSNENLSRIKKLDIESQVMVLRYLYYVKDISVVSDFEYDKIEAMACATLPEDSPVHLCGSSLDRSYGESIKDFVSSLEMDQ